MDTYINVKINTSLGKKKATKLLDDIDKLYNKYQILTDTYNKKSQLYYINNNTSDAREITIDKDLYHILELSLLWNKKSDGKFNINMGSVIAVWKKYRDAGTGVPSMEELKNSGSIDINNVVLLGNNKIKNTKPNIDLGGVAKGYVTGKAGDYLKAHGVSDFIINAGGNVVVGKNSTKKFYNIGIENPENINAVYDVVKGNNIAVVTSGGYERFYEYNGVRYHHIIDPDTLFPSHNMLGVTIVANDSGLADILSTTLFLMKPKDAIKLVNTLDNVEAIIYVDHNTILRSDGFKKYE
jgi:thiamine biosynthesis lipoprotein